MSAVALTPVLAAVNGDAFRHHLPCGLSIEFVDPDGVTLTTEAFVRLRMSVPAFVRAAGEYSITYIEWVAEAEGVFVNRDGCWPSVATAPSTFIEHNAVPGAPVLYVVDPDTAIFTGLDSEAGMRRIRDAMPGGLGPCAMVWDRSGGAWRRWPEAQ